jgi:hypothetical protein
VSSLVNALLLFISLISQFYTGHTEQVSRVIVRLAFAEGFQTTVQGY